MNANVGYMDTWSSYTTMNEEGDGTPTKLDEEAHRQALNTRLLKKGIYVVREARNMP